jgi:hypothetical protein
MELTKQNLHQCVDDMGRIFMDIMSVDYGVRKVEMVQKLGTAGQPTPLGMQIPETPSMVDFDFAVLEQVQMGVKQDVGASSYWSEIANMQTLDNLLMNNHINAVQYLERMPNGYIARKQELIAELKAQMGMTAPSASSGTGMSMETTSTAAPVEGGSGNAALQRALNREGA